MSWPLMWRSDHDCALAAALLRVQKIEDDYRQQLEEQAAKHAVQLAEAVAANQRLEGRNRALAEQLEAAQIGSGFDAAQAKRAADRIANLRKAVLRARREAADAPAKARAAVASEMGRLKAANASLDGQARVLQRSNEAQARELYDLRTGGGGS